MAKYIRPTVDTKFHIDFGWWKKGYKDLHSTLCDYVCDDMPTPDKPVAFDWIDLNTGEVFEIDILWHRLHEQCGSNADFIDDYSSLVSAVFRVFIANNNTPLTPTELYHIIKKQSPSVILKTIAGKKIYDGIRPVQV